MFKTGAGAKAKYGKAEDSLNKLHDTANHLFDPRLGSQYKNPKRIKKKPTGFILERRIAFGCFLFSIFPVTPYKPPRLQQEQKDMNSDAYSRYPFAFEKG